MGTITIQLLLERLAFAIIFLGPKNGLFARLLLLCSSLFPCSHLLASELESLAEINRHFNQYRYQSENGNRDYWKTFAEFTRSGGDCEDFALAKYHFLKTHDIPEEDLRLVYGKVSREGQRPVPHLVLSITLREKTYYLDNRFSQIQTIDQMNWIPILRFNQNIFEYYQASSADWIALGENYTHPSWQDYLKRMGQIQFSAAL